MNLEDKIKELHSQLSELIDDYTIIEEAGEITVNINQLHKPKTPITLENTSEEKFQEDIKKLCGIIREINKG